MMTRRTYVAGTVIVALSLMLGMVVGTVTVGAQDGATPATMATPEAVSATPEQISLRPAHVHAGTCDDLGGIIFPLTDVSTVDVTTVEPLGAVGQSLSTVEASLDELLAADHAINVHESVGNMAQYIACGDLTGDVTDGQLVVELEELNASGYTGEALLEDAGDGTTLVSIALTAIEPGTSATFDATPALGAEPADTEFQIGTILITTANNLRVRAQPTTDADALTTLPEGTRLQVIGGPEQVEAFVWYEVEVLDTDESVSGWVAADANFVESVPEADD